jgi:NAD(P)-dependent dehydrogenase (short-subunit alcohol dehydrogenase family)
MADQPVCLVTGVGPGTGTAMVRRFHEGGYAVAMLARTKARLDALEAELPGARGYVCDLSDEAAVNAAVSAVNEDLGAPEVVIHNAVGGARGDFMTIDPAILQQNFQVNVMGLLYLSRAVAPAMIDVGHGSIIVTGNTAATRGKDFFAGFAPTKAAQRILAESIARSAGPKGVHVAYIIIDAVIDLRWTRKAFADAPDDFFIQPASIAENAWYLHSQDKSAWTFLSEIRTFGERW